MSLITKIDKIPEDSVHRNLTIKIVPKFGYGQIKYLYAYILKGDNIILPFAYAVQVLSIPRPLRTSFPAIRVRFVGKLRPDQQSIKKDAIKRLNKTGSVIISAGCGAGKTVIAISMATSIRLKTLIIVNKIILMKQWEESIFKFCSKFKIQKLTSKSIKQDVDFYIMNAQNIEKKDRNFYKDIGNVIVDECHLIMAETLSRSLQYITPRYLIGLSATPYRPDGLNALLNIYFGKDKVIRKLYKKHIVYKVDTGFKPTIERTIQGRLNWGSILDQQANNAKRNDIILNIIQRFQTRNFLVLVKRVSQGRYLVAKLEEMGISVTNLIGNKQEFETSARVLIGTCQKVGTGFDHPKLNTLILGADVQEYFIQYLGRIFRVRDSEPMVFDLVDNNSILRKHFATRERVYKKHGGVLKLYH